VKLKRVHWLQHVPFEGLGSIEPWLTTRGYSITRSRLYAHEPLPNVDDFDWLIVMGGPMNVDDEAHYPWLAAEKCFIKVAIDAGKTVLGICLGAQLMARALDAKVQKTGTKEIGWFPITLMNLAALSPLFEEHTPVFQAFHWHSDSFAVPKGAVKTASSEACANQAFVFGERAVALQFHLETTQASAQTLIKHCADDLQPGTWVQSAKAMLAEPERFKALNRHMDSLLARLAAA